MNYLLTLLQPDLIMFAVIALIILFCSVMVVIVPDIVHAAFWLLGTLTSVAVLFILLYAPLLGVMQLLVYVGGIGVLILFAIMLTGRRNHV
ncbi:MAG: NADH-quinone oxidoreductase subunit J [Methermicoccaceae archaeon]